MNRLVLSCLVGTTCLLSAPISRPAWAGGDDMAACKASGDRYAAAIATGDPEKVAALFTKAGLVTAPEGIYSGRQAIAAFDRGYVVPGVGQTVTPSRVDTVASGLLCSGTYTVKFAPGFPIKQVGGNYTALLVKEGSTWQHAMLAYNYVPPPMPSQGQ